MTGGSEEESKGWTGNSEKPKVRVDPSLDIFGAIADLKGTRQIRLARVSGAMQHQTLDSLME